MTPEDRIEALGITLPAAPAPLGAYLPVQRTGDLLFLSGILPLAEGRLPKTGRVGGEVSAEEGRELARAAAVNALAILKSHLGRLEKIRRCVKITGYIASAAGFTGQAAVLNGAS
ncbi:MAG: RidA family protein [Nitrospiraceae bacterium]|nr:RidA family protein [Nitrospiraceae bacterium]